ncbi:hypothetical protein GmHk_20G058576 [Glycine max]|nr:hypothetical protein GmHk_20G058576 [Glycine max]
MDPDFAGAPPDTAFHQIKEKRRHRNSYTVAACGPVVSRGKRAMDSEELAELARVDPKRLQVKVQQLAIQSANLDNSISFLQLALQQFHNPPSHDQQHLDPQQAQLSMPNPLPSSSTQSFGGEYGLNNFSNFSQLN